MPTTSGPPPPTLRPDPAEQAVTALLTALGVGLSGASLADTPRRVAAAYRELLEPHEFTATAFPNDGGCDELVLVRAIPFNSLCEHHLLPFFGVARAGHVPGKRVLGLSKPARVVQASARGLQIQERMTTRIADWLTAELEPLGAGAVIEAQHTCVSIRGIKAIGSWTTTSALRGVLREDQQRREEFMRRTENTGDSGTGW
ncbi:GTP cyclohydrolase I [Streptomyces sp. KMM 9044]|uniref:GTP cyclohydrolase I n=1 Tax=Streptomyces sp. KMM 9044 TaxID=2744474 RepID=UPI002150A17C|nr:GTP cyclohydrolase I [Streptomyces sp. KMM 9044]WAX76550.1 GTP cyclohydrolase I [Streptomyces sp. KMM 9044]